MHQLTPHPQGSALLVALASVAILATIGATSFSYLQRKYRSVHQVTAWQEALLNAEGGVDLAMAEIRKSISAPTEMWNGWHQAEDASNNLNSVVDPKASAISYTSHLLLRKGEGGQRSYSKVTVDAPASLIDSRGERSYRIRSLGVAEIPGGNRVAGDKADSALRKLNLVFDRITHQAVTFPNATRLVEVVAQPVGAFDYPNIGDLGFDMNNHNIIIDSYNSRDPAKSTNGRYDPAKRQEHGDIATNGQVLGAGNAHVYGGAYTNGGTVLNSGNITGPIANDFYRELPRISRPTTYPDMGTPAYVTASATFTAKLGAPAHYQLSKITLASSEVLHIQGDPAGRETFIDIVVTDQISLSGQARIVLEPGVYARIFFEGNVDIAGGGFANPGTALNLQLYGIEPKADTNGNKPARSVKVAGNANYMGTIFAPDHDLTFVGGGSEGQSFGSFVGRTLRITGGQQLHYDEALRGTGLITDYKISSWFEDAR